MRTNTWHRTAAVALLWSTAVAACANQQDAQLEPGGVQLASQPITQAQVDFVDVLFVVDNSGSMHQEQAALQAQFPRLIDTLTRGTASDGATFTPVRDLHLGVVSSDMGLIGVTNNFPGCNTPRHFDGGDDGRLRHSATAPGCKAEYPPFLSFQQGQTDPVQLAQDFGCIATLGTTGCGFEQQLEAGLKALWPKVYTDANGKTYPPEANPILFLSTSEQGVFGRGDLPVEQGGNLGFLRSDPAQGLSLVAIIIVSDEEDCSSRNPSHFASTNDPNDPLSKQGVNLRCFYHKQNLFDIQRYVQGYKGLRPGNEHLVFYGAIVGVPPDLVDERASAGVDFDSERSPSRDAYYDRILSDPRMQEVPTSEQIPAIANLAPSCMRADANGEQAAAYPPIRMVQVAKAFGPNAVVQSICQDDFGPAVDAILKPIVYQLQNADQQPKTSAPATDCADPQNCPREWRAARHSTAHAWRGASHANDCD